MGRGHIWRPSRKCVGAAVIPYFLNDLSVSEGSSLRLFADDARLSRRIDRTQDSEILQSNIDELQAWATLNGMVFNTSKYQIQRFGKSDVAPYYSCPKTR